MKSILVFIFTFFSLNSLSYAAVLGDCTNNNIVDVSDIICTVNIILNPVENTDALCSDGGDNDFDGNTDCAYSDCTSALPCLIEICDDNIDNDLDAATDCADSDCEHDAACSVACASDSDCSGATPFCNAVNNTCVASLPLENTNALCSDGTDNNGNGHIDCDDASCSGLAVCPVSCASDADCSGATPTCNLTSNLCQ